jgi:hypothetical protein
MADRKISDLTALTTPAVGDFLPIVDISETAAASKNKRITIEELFRGVPLGTAAAPSIAIEGDEDTGVFSPGANQLAISTNGTARLFVDASGNVGVGTTGPATKLDIRDPSEVGITIGTTSAPYGRFYTDGTITALLGINNSPLVFSTNSGTAFAERMRITAAGLVGLGTSAPNTLLHVFGGDLKVQKSATVTDISELTFSTQFRTGRILSSYTNPVSSTETYIAFHTNRAGQGNDTVGEAMRIAGGNVGIGTTSPSDKLEARGGAVVVGFSDNTTRTNKLFAGFGYETGGTLYGNVSIRSNYDNTNNSSTLNFHTASGAGADTERARIDSSGRLLIGTSTAFNSGSTIEAAGSSGGVVTLTNTNTDITGANSVFGQINFYTADTSGTNTGIFAKITAESNRNFDGSGDGGMDLKFFTGNVTIGANTPTERLRITSAGVLQVADAGDITVGTTTGTKIGTATTQKLGFYNATPVVQPAAVADATTAVDVITQLNDLLAKLRTLGIIAT